MKKLLIAFAVGSLLLTTSAFAQNKGKNLKKEVKTAAQKTKSNFLFPAVDVIKSAEKIVVIAELPGLTKKDFNLEFIEGEKNYLEISGIKPDIKLKVKGKKIQSERFVGKFVKKINIKERIVKSKISAEFKNNVLVVYLPILKYKVKNKIKVK